MIKINDKEIKDYKITISIDPLSAIINGKRMKTESPYICIETKDKIIAIETIYPINWLKELKINKIVDIKKYIAEIEFVHDGFLENTIYDIEESTIEKLENNKYKLIIKTTKETIFEFNEIITVIQ